MDRKKLHEEFVTGFTGSPISDIYSAVAICVLGILTSHFVSKNVNGSTAATKFADFIFNWACTLVCVTLYSGKHFLLATILSIVAIVAYLQCERPGKRSKHRNDMRLLKKFDKEERNNKKSKNNANRKKDTANGESEKVSETTTRSKSASLVSHRDFLTIYRSAMMVITITSILAVDFPVFPRRFAKAETWGTSLMDLGVGSFVFSMGVVSARQSIKFPTQDITSDLRRSFIETINLVVLGIIRLVSLKVLDYHEHVSEYGIHWNFFFTLGFLPSLFSLLKRVPIRSVLIKAIIVAFGYELVLKNTGLLEWILTAPRTDIFSQNKEGLCSFVGYLSIFAFGNAFGLKILPAKVLLKDIIRTAFKWTVSFHIALYIVTISTEPSRRLANLPYILWVVAFNSGLLFVFALLEYLFDLKPSESHEAVNRVGNTVFVLGNLATGLINMCINTIQTTKGSGMLVLVAYQAVMMTACELLNKKTK